MIRALLTIDDIPSNNTYAIVDYLNEAGIQAVMFAVGGKAEKKPEPVVYAIQHGMIVGNHNYSHPHFSELQAEEGILEIERCEAVLDRIYGMAGSERVYRPFRFPYGDKGGKNRDTLQPWTMFDPEAKQARHDTVFPAEMKRAFEMGAGIAK